MYEAVFLLLILECLFAGLLVSPLSASTRRVIVRTVEQSSLSAIARTPSKYVAVALTAAWLYSLREVMNTQSRLEVCHGKRWRDDAQQSAPTRPPGASDARH